MSSAWLDELSEWLRIPSVSADPRHEADVRRAAAWLRDYVRDAGGTADFVETSLNPLVVGELRASSGADAAPTVLVYGHYDVQPPAPLDLWETPPFAPDVRDGWLYARGAVDDKGSFYMLVNAATSLAREGALPVNVRVVSDGEEEVGGRSVVDFLAADERGADACVIFDGGMEGRGAPAFALAVRGALVYEVTVETGRRDLHSGLGNTALNAIHALVQTLGGVLPKNGRLPDPLRAGVVPPTPADRESWTLLKSGEEALAAVGATPHDDRAADEFRLRIAHEPSVDVNGILGGKPGLINTTIPATAQANLTFRVAPGQDLEAVAEAAERLLREAAPTGSRVEVVRQAGVAPGVTSADHPAVRIGLDAFERVLGVRPLLLRVGGTLPIVSILTEKRIPTILTGFGLPESNVHSPNERMLLEYVPLGIAVAREVLVSLAALPGR